MFSASADGDRAASGDVACDRVASGDPADRDRADEAGEPEDAE